MSVTYGVIADTGAGDPGGAEAHAPSPADCSGAQANGVALRTATAGGDRDSGGARPEAIARRLAEVNSQLLDIMIDVDTSS